MGLQLGILCIMSDPQKNLYVVFIHIMRQSQNRKLLQNQSY